MHRRRYLSMLCAAGLAGCQALGTDGSEGDDAETATPTSSPTPTPTTTPEPVTDTSEWWAMPDGDARATRSIPGMAPTKPGDPVWVAGRPGQVNVTRPTVGPRRVYHGLMETRDDVTESKLVARSLADGSVRWTRWMPHEFVGQPALGPGPDGQTTLFAVSGRQYHFPDYVRGVVYALDPATGDVRWEWSPDGLVVRKILLGDGSLLIGNGSTRGEDLYCLDAATGDLRWAGSGVASSGYRTVHDGAIYGHNSAAAFSASLEDGTWRWLRDVEHTRLSVARPTVDPERDQLYTFDARGVSAHALSSGETVWTFAPSDIVGSDGERIDRLPRPVLLPDLLVFRSRHGFQHAQAEPGRCYGVDPATGDLRWKLDTARPTSSVVGAGGRVLVRAAESAESFVYDADEGVTVTDGSESLVAIDGDGSVAWSHPGRWRPVALASGRLIAAQGPPAYEHPVETDRTVKMACFDVS